MSASQQIAVSGADGCCLSQYQSGFLQYPQGWTRRSDTMVRVWLSGFKLSVDIQQTDQLYSMVLGRPTANETGIGWSLITGNFTKLRAVEVTILMFFSFGGAVISDGQLTRSGLQSNQVFTMNQNGVSYYNASLVGLSGIALSNNAPMSISLTISNQWQLQATVTSSVQYVAVDYLLISIMFCSGCPGRPYLFNNECVQQCPAGATIIGETCVGCLNNQEFIGGKCVCKQGYASVLGDCLQCPPGFDWNGNGCIPKAMNCADRPGTQWNGLTCVCQQPFTNWDGRQCSSIIQAQQSPQIVQTSPQFQNLLSPQSYNPLSSLVNRLVGAAFQPSPQPSQLAYQQLDAQTQMALTPDMVNAVAAQSQNLVSQQATLVNSNG